MSKLSKEVLDEGRSLLAAGDADGFDAWMRKHTPLMATDYVRSEYRNWIESELHRDVGTAARMFERVFLQYDPGRERALALGRLGCFLLLVLGVVGGIASMIKMLF